MNWNAKEQKFCIVYEDGAVTVVSVDAKVLIAHTTKIDPVTSPPLRSAIISSVTAVGVQAWELRTLLKTSLQVVNYQKQLQASG